MVGQVTRRGPIVYLAIGNQWYEYDERRQLGAGAMGVVYEGREGKTGAAVAVKRVVDRYANNPEIRRRARQEAELMFRFIISRFVKGENIDTFINNNVRSLPHAEHRICELFFPVLDALSYIHQKGIIHMDIKPSNIMMEQGRNVRLMDLGIADVTDTVNSATSGMMGTPKYAAPEQFSSAEAKPQLTAATDIYEAGVTLYELLTAYNPFNANTVAEAREMHLETILEKRGGLSDSVYAVIRKATAINPKERYQSAAAMKMDLKQALIAPPPTDRRWMYIAGAAIGAIAILIIILLLIL